MHSNNLEALDQQKPFRSTHVDALQKGVLLSSKFPPVKIKENILLSLEDKI